MQYTALFWFPNGTVSIKYMHSNYYATALTYGTLVDYFCSRLKFIKTSHIGQTNHRLSELRTLTSCFAASMKAVIAG